MNKKTNVRTITLVGLGVALNIIGAFIALNLKLPIYLDSIGTIMIAALLGPKYAVITGVCGSLVSGMTFDIYSLYFAPVQISTGFFAGLMYEKGFLKGRKTPLGVVIFTIPTSIISAMIAAYLFGGVTSSGSSYIVQILRVVGMPDVVSVFIVQIFTDYADKFVAVALVGLGVNALPKSIKLSMTSK
ncbi:ECF transporter S component [Romboutsia sedimentorum]|uniref:ECF transporter S component n=1 Tax=Romboutsia sedimentorum TaxID=1368474 RepID=A0ABT7E6J9_9FIRM|nr:ECF transporter S component [Romboutsia sedimentorum]MDK2562560.1 ECF transporter S component [Romboutsia sedimentorum]MDK2584802.1 ECF transporter S component [Romboutsia sedimentorum]